MGANSSANSFTDRNRRPWPLLMLLEGRAFLELGATLAAMPLLQRAPHGDGHAVLVLPGLLASDRSTTLLRRFLSGLGYGVEGWSQGQNRGPRAGVEARMADTLLAMRERSHGKVSVIGWSLGGIYARVLASRHSGDVRQVITLGSPLYGDPTINTNASGAYRFVSGLAPDAYDKHSDNRGDAPPVPVTSIFSRSDAIVSWRASVEAEGPLAENIEIDGSHLGLGHNAAALYAIADRLAQPEGAWKPFEPRGPTRLLYGKRWRTQADDT